MRAKLALLGMTVGVALAVGVSCADKPPVGLIVAIQTNLSVTKDFDQLGLYITADGVPILTQTYAIEGGNVRLPSTIAIAPPKNENAVIRVRAVAFKSDAAKVLREGITTVPTTRLAVMPLPLKWLDSGSGKGSEAEWQVNPFASARSICPDLQTQKDGICTTSTFAVGDLPNYEASEIFGGGSEDGTGSSCFDVAGCFAQRVAVPVDETACTVVAPAGTTNVAVATTNGDGEPVGGENLIVLDETDLSKNGAVLSLPKTLCNPSGMKPQRKAIYLSGTCETKKEKYGVCGPHSVGKPLAPLADGGSLDGGPISDAGDAGSIGEQIGASEPLIGTMAASGGWVYGVGADPNNAGAFRIVAYPTAGGAPSITGLGPGPTVDFASTTLVLGPGGTDLRLLRASPSSAQIEVYGLNGGKLLPTPNTATHPLPFNVLATSSARLYSAAGAFSPDGGGTLDIVSFDKASLNTPNFVFPQVFDPVTAMTYSIGPDLDAGADSGLTVGYLFVGAGNKVIRLSNPEGFLASDPAYAIASTEAISGLAVTANGKLVVAGLDKFASLTVAVGDAYASNSLSSLTTVATGLPALPAGSPLGPTLIRFHGLAVDTQYVYFAHDSGIDYAPLDASSASKRLVSSPGVAALSVDGTFLYFTVSQFGAANPPNQGFFRVPRPN